jgi:signal transduction histidine kinase/ligand-binding sensor domain-containing protein
MTLFLRYALFLLLPGAISGMASNTIAPGLSDDIWDTAAGFPGGYVYAITQTGDGYLWIGTSKGLLRYDGLRFANIEGVSGAETKFPVLGLVTDSGDQLWATDDRTHLFQQTAGMLKGPLPDNGRHPYRVAPLEKTRDGWLLFASELQGLIEYEHGKPRLLLEASLVPSRPTAVAQTADGTFWIGTRDTGLFRLTVEGTSRQVQRVAGLMNVKVNCLLPMADSTLLIGTEKGLVSLHKGNLIREMLPEIGNTEILACTKGQKGDVWIGAGSQVFKARAKDIDADGRISSLDHLAVRGTVTALFEDRDGNLWIGEPEKIERHHASTFTTYFSSAGLPCHNCGAIYVDQQEHVWFAPWDGGLFRLSQGTIQPIEVAGLKDDGIYSIAGGDDEVWIARKHGGLTRLRLEGDALQSSTYTRQDGLAQDAVYSVYREPDGTVWAGTLDAGISRFRGGLWHSFTTKDGLPSNTISAITGDNAGSVFAGTPDGLAELKNDHWIAYTSHDGLPPGPVQSLFLDHSDTLWIGTSKGISYLRAGAIHVPLGVPEALYGEILGIVESNGSLWITTRDRVLRVKSAALLNLAFGEGDYREFGVTEGLPSRAGVERNRSVVLDHRGRIWFSLEEGISVLQPTAFERPPFPVTVRLDGLIVDGRPIESGNQVRIPPGRRRVTFRYAGVNVSSPEAVRYRYRLDAVDTAWSEPTALREIDYTNVPPGQFRFQVIASNPDGVWSDQETAMTLEVEPAYFQTRWFQVATAVSLVLLAFALYRFRLQQLHRQFNVGLEARVNERTRIARELHDTLLQTLHGLMFQFQAVRNLMTRRPDEAVRSLDDAITETEKALVESRDAIQGLRSDQIAKGNLAELLKATSLELATSGIAKQEPPVFDLIEEGESQTLSPIAKNEIYRIAIEILRNAFWHAQAHRIEAEIRFDDHMLRVRIRDDGTGIDPKVLKDGGRAGHWGLRGVRERAQRIGAQLDFWSEAGAGTEVQLAVPAAVAYETPRDGVGSRLFRKVKNRGQRS